MAVFTTERTARKTRKCSGCGKPIESGKRYRSTVITPGGEFGYEGWSRYASHLSDMDCYYELGPDPSPSTAGTETADA